MDAHAPQSIGSLAPEERVALGAAGLRTFFRIADRWELSGTEQRMLLGDVGRTTHHAWRGRSPDGAESYTTDRLLRLSLVLGIYDLLQRLHGEAPAYADAWMRAPNRARPFAGRAPLELVREEGLPGLLLVRRVLEAIAGGGLVPVDAMAWEGEDDAFPSQQRPALLPAHAGAPAGAA